MTMREWYAGMAMQGILAAHADCDLPLPRSKTLVRWAFEYADAMLAASQVTPQPGPDDHGTPLADMAAAVEDDEPAF